MNMNQKLYLAIITSFALLLSSCATVPLTEGGKKIRVLAPDEVSSCKKLGKSNTSVTATALGMDRPPETIAQELASIARNSASNMGGDTIVPLTVIAEGRQTFVIYKCIDPDG